MKKNRIAALLLAALFCLPLAGCGQKSSESDLSYIKDKGTLVVGITDFSPMDYQDDNGEWIGFDADMARKVAEALGVEAQFVEITWDNKILELDAKSIDCVWNGMTLTDEVKSSMSCTNSYASNAQVVVVPAEQAEQYPDKDSVSELNFAVESGSAGEAAVKDLGFSYRPVLTQADSLMEVASGASDACVIDLLMAGAMVGEGTSYPDLTHTAELTTEEYGIGFRKDSDVTAEVNKIMADLYADGTTAEIAQTYGVQDAVIPQ